MTSFTQADVAAGNVVYVHDGGESTADTFTFALHDGTTTLASDVFSISVNPVNDPPSDIYLSHDWFEQGRPIGSVVADLTTADPDNTNANLTYSIVGAPSIFAVVGDKLVLTASPHSASDPRTYTVTLRTTDGEYSFDKTFTITMRNDAFIAYRKAHEAYLADPVIEPSLSASIAKTLLTESPRHAWFAQPIKLSVPGKMLKQAKDR